tara:strand:- start:456 stop:725 length:270 start_codon:yes stop_codon:yes gene_type:complete
MDADKAAQLLSENTYHFAKSMPTIPHSYTRGREWHDNNEFIKVAWFIFENGVKESFGKKTYNYFYANDYKYWIMNTAPDTTILINRAKP